MQTQTDTSTTSGPAHTPWETVRADVDSVPMELPAPVFAPVIAPPPEPMVDEEIEAVSPVGAGLFTIPLLCLGIGIIACCVLIPAADENRRLVYERERLKADLDQITRQIDVNSDFLKRVPSDLTLSERLAQRQMKMVRQGASVLELKGQPRGKEMSPFELVTLPPPPELPPYRPVGGFLSTICRDPHGQLYLMGVGMLLLAAGLVLGSSPKPDSSDLSAAG